MNIYILNIIITIYQLREYDSFYFPIPVWLFLEFRLCWSEVNSKDCWRGFLLALLTTSEMGSTVDLACLGIVVLARIWLSCRLKIIVDLGRGC